MTDLIGFGQPPYKLSMGCGPARNGEGWIHVDNNLASEPDFLGWVEDVELAQGSCAEVYCSHILEHFSRKDAQELMNKWSSWLVPGGVLWIAVPNAEIVMREALHSQAVQRWETWHDAMRHLFAWQTTRNDTHRYGYCFHTLKAAMEQAGIIDIQRFAPWVEDSTRGAKITSCDGFPIDISLNVRGRKP